MYIIAEAGVNHNGSYKYACDLINAAVSAGANAIKFQTFQSQLLANESARLAPYQEKNTGIKQSQFELLKKLELSKEDHFKLRDYAKEQGIDFLSSPFDDESVRFLCTELELDTIKIPSGEITNAPYLWRIAKYGSNVILSTGMASVDEIHACLDVLAYGYLKTDKPISLNQMSGFSQSQDGHEVLKKKVTLLHCTSEYPASYETINLKAIDNLREVFGLQTGFSDHSEGIIIPIAATAFNISVLEKHITLNKNMDGPDHKASIEPDEFKSMVGSIRRVELALGDGKKVIGNEELKNRKVVRKSLFTASTIKKGESFSENNLVALRPEGGISPMKYWEVLESKATQDYRKGDLIKF